MRRLFTTRRAWRPFCICLLVIALWMFLVLYPNPLRLSTSLRRLDNPPIDAAAVQALSGTMPENATEIEKAVLETIRYRYDWQAYNSPWYFPTVDEVLGKGAGDCKGRAIVLASILEAKGIPYQFHTSPVHVWVDYEGKAENSLENQQAGFYTRDPRTGARSFHFPHIGITEFLGIFWGGFWAPMPVARKVLMTIIPAGIAAAALAWPRVRERLH